MQASVTQRRVVIVDDSRTVQAMLDNAFSKRRDFRVVGYADDALSAAEIIRRLMPDVVTIDLCMPYLDGAALLEMIADLRGVCKIVVSDKSLTNLVLTSKLREAGASACIGKSELIHDPVNFFKKINAVTDAVVQAKSNPLSGVGLSPAVSARYSAHTTPPKPIFAFPVPADENARITFIQQNMLATFAKERQFDLVTKHVAKVTAFPACLLTVIDRDTQWIKSAFGLEVASTPRHQAFCNYTISQGGTFVVSNAASDERFLSNPLVMGAPNIRSYAGHPVMTAEGIAIASLCVIDTRPRTVSRHVIDQLAGMAEIVGEMIDQRTVLAA